MRSAFGVFALGLWLGKVVVVATDSGEGTKRNGLRRLRFISGAHYRYSNQYYKETNGAEEGETTPQANEQRTGEYNYQSAYKNSFNQLLKDDEGTGQDTTISTSTKPRQANDRGRDRDKIFGLSHFWKEERDALFADGFDTRGVGFSMPNLPATTQPRPPAVATSTPSTRPPVPSPTIPPTSVPTVPATTNAPTGVPPAPTPVPVESPMPSNNNATLPPAEPPTREDREVLIQAKCGITALERSRDILVELLKVSKASDLVNPATSQFAARDWIDNIDEAILCPENVNRIHQRYRLALLYFQMGGSQWTRCRAENTSLKVVYDDLVAEVDEGCPGVPFLDKSNECDWYGMACGEMYDEMQAEWADQYFPLEVVDLQSNNLAGVLFDELYGLETLKVLQLSGNERIAGSLSEDIALMGSLQELNFSGNALNGSLPTSIYALSELTLLGLAGNDLDGKLSNDIGSLSNLTSVQLQSNMLNGTVPESGLLLLQRLVTLSIQDNPIEGSLNALCDVLEERREVLDTYLSTIEADCDKVSCSCCTCS
ncbi:leucine rich repeat LRR-containing protein [Nitzschia inconspicua]|uniref:Leucine rich repeat LRR-containing protein n=1 Tax=Nitzschia inconspicua TaxID=303405 RepID=A0A9K3KEL3_9STRA|nr:leucine rich repeat LRR-containing protein [Nitzschia inconspicua]